MDEIKAGPLPGWIEISRDDLLYFTFVFSELESLMRASGDITEFAFKSSETILIEIRIEDAVSALKEVSHG